MPYYFDELVWNNIMGFIDIKPFKKDTFVNGTYSKRVPFSGFNETFEIIGRTKCFIKCVINKVETKKKIFIKDGIESIKMNHVTMTAHDNERYMFSTKKEWERFRKGYHSEDESEDESNLEDYERWEAQRAVAMAMEVLQRRGLTMQGIN